MGNGYHFGRGFLWRKHFTEIVDFLLFMDKLPMCNSGFRRRQLLKKLFYVKTVESSVVLVLYIYLTKTCREKYIIFTHKS